MRLGLHGEVQGVDVRPLALGTVGHADVLEPVKELEAHPAPGEHLPERREYHVAHSRLHLPEEGPPVGEERPEVPAQRGAGGDPRAAHVAVLVGEREVIEGTDLGAVDGPFRGAIEPQPLATVEVVDGIEAARVRHELETKRSAYHRERQVDDLPEAPELVVSRNQRLELRREPPR